MKRFEVKKHAAWRRQEKALEEAGARRVVQSGAGYSKGDNRGDMYLVQAKTTAKKQYPLKLEELQKTKREAQMEDRQPIMQVQLQDQFRFAVMPWDDFEELLEAAGRKL